MSSLQRVPDGGLPTGYADAWRAELLGVLQAISGRLACVQCAREYRTRGGLTYLECGHDIGKDPEMLRLASLHRELGLALAAYAADDPCDEDPIQPVLRLDALVAQEAANRARLPR